MIIQILILGFKGLMMIILYDFSMAVKKKLKSFILNSYDFYALVTKGLKWLTVSITSKGRTNLLWKQIDAPVGFGGKFCIYNLQNKTESTLRKIKIIIVFEMIVFQWGFYAIFMVPFSLTLTHENVRGPGIKYISWAIKMPWKGQKSTLRIFMAH